MPRAAILSIGDEILLGQQVDTNSAWLSTRLADLGWTVEEHRSVGDDRTAIASALRALAIGRGAVVATGGLGPTLDDLTREALGDLVDPGAPLVEDPAGLAHLAAWFAGRGRAMSASNLRQALRPPSAWLVPNANGTAPGLAAAWRPPGGEEPCQIRCLPGPPREMRPMFDDHVAATLSQAAEGTTILSGTVSQIGLGESAAAERLGELMERHRNPSVGTTASGGVVKARVRLVVDGGTGAPAAFDRTMRRVAELWSPYAFAEKDCTIATAVAALLRERGLTLAVAESCTGGLLAAMIVELAGASDFFVGGVIAYSNELKTALLAVGAPTLAAHGAVSEPTARAMAIGACARCGAACGIAVTGVAGPAGGSAEKPVGTVFIAVATPAAPGSAEARRVRVRRFVFTGDRQDIRERAGVTALQMLRLELVGAGDAPLLWEVGRGR